jgi:hypothetical protein
MTQRGHICPSDFPWTAAHWNKISFRRQRRSDASARAELGGTGSNSAARFGFVEPKMTKSKMRSMTIATNRATEVRLDVIGY